MLTYCKKKILIISALFPPEPIVSAKLSYEIANALSNKNIVTVLSPKPSRPYGFQFSEETFYSNFNHIQVGSFICASSSMLGRFLESYSFGKHCYEFISDNHKNIDVIYANTWPLLAQYFAINAASKFNIPIILHVQDIYPESLIGKLPNAFKNLCFKLLLPIDKFTLQNATKVIGISPSMIAYLSNSRKVDLSKFELVRNWQNDNLFLNYFHYSIKKENFVFMYLGNINLSACVRSLIYSFHKACLPKSKLIIAGNGSDRKECEALAHKLGNGQIEFCDVAPEEVPELQSQADILLLPLKKGISKTATPSKLTAYLLSSKPVIACVEKDSDVANIIISANCGYVAEPENIDSITSAMDQVYYMKKDQLEKWGSNGRNYAVSHLSKDVNLSKVISVIENINR